MRTTIVANVSDSGCRRARWDFRSHSIRLSLRRQWFKAVLDTVGVVNGLSHHEVASKVLLTGVSFMIHAAEVLLGIDGGNKESKDGDKANHHGLRS